MRYRTEGDVRRAQQDRREAADRMPSHEWSAKREALIASGLVADRAADRSTDTRNRAEVAKETP